MDVWDYFLDAQGFFSEHTSANQICQWIIYLRLIFQYFVLITRGSFQGVRGLSVSKQAY